jgi:hypothetical protein
VRGGYQLKSKFSYFVAQIIKQQRENMQSVFESVDSENVEEVSELSLPTCEELVQQLSETKHYKL